MSTLFPTRSFSPSHSRTTFLTKSHMAWTSLSTSSFTAFSNRYYYVMKWFKNAGNFYSIVFYNSLFSVYITRDSLLSSRCVWKDISTLSCSSRSSAVFWTWLLILDFFSVFSLFCLLDELYWFPMLEEARPLKILVEFHSLTTILLSLLVSPEFIFLTSYLCTRSSMSNGFWSSSYALTI